MVEECLLSHFLQAQMVCLDFHLQEEWLDRRLKECRSLLQVKAVYLFHLLACLCTWVDQVLYRTLQVWADLHHINSHMIQEETDERDYPRDTKPYLEAVA